MTTSKELLAAYDKAMAVMSRPCRFVEWKTYGGSDDPKSWGPFGVTKERAGATKDIEGERWIYVFRAYSRMGQAGVWVEELHLDKDGNLSATDMEKARVERDKRPAPVAIGKSISFARRINSVAMEYYFFATRIRLPLASIDEIGPDIMSYVAPINFEADDSNLAGEKDGVLLVPVLDPITVAIHLHANYVAAADSVIDYTAIHADQDGDKQKKVGKRLKKVLLAQLISAIIAPNVDTTNQLVHLTKRVGLEVEDFLKSFNEQVRFRTEWRDRWCSLLTKWLKGKTMSLLAKAHLKTPLEDFPKYLIPFSLCLTRLSASPDGRKCLDALYADKGSWVHVYLLPTDTPTGDVFQVIRKGGGAVFESLKEWGTRIILEPSLYKTIKFHETLGFVTGNKDNFTLVTRKVHFDGGVTTNMVQGNKIIEVTELHYMTEPKLEPKWEGAAKKFGVIIEAINTVFALKAVDEAMANGTTTEKLVAFTNLLGSGLDLTVAILQFTKVSSRTLAKLSFVSGVIDTVLAVRDTVVAYEKGDTGGMVGSAVIAGGSALGAASGAMVLLGVPGANVVAVIGLALVALGTAIKLLFGDNDTDYHKLCRHCEWGIDVGKGDNQPDYSDKKFKDWQGDYDEQLKVAVNILCGFDVERNDMEDFRSAKVSPRWLPNGTQMELAYHEKWDGGDGNQELKGTVTFEDGKPPALKGKDLTIKASGKAYVVRPLYKFGEKATVQKINGVPIKVWELKGIQLEVQLTFKLGEESFKVPHNGAKTASLA